jgi:hypothetical protein
VSNPNWSNDKLLGWKVRHLPRLGRNKHQIGRTLAYGRQFSTAELLRFLYPRKTRLEVWHWKAARQAAELGGLIRAPGRRRRPLLWIAKPESDDK